MVFGVAPISKRYSAPNYAQTKHNATTTAHHHLHLSKVSSLHN